jgi:hypothetical protein
VHISLRRIYVEIPLHCKSSSWSLVQPRRRDESTLTPYSSRERTPVRKSSSPIAASARGLMPRFSYHQTGQAQNTDHMILGESRRGNIMPPLVNSSFISICTSLRGGLSQLRPPTPQITLFPITKLGAYCSFSSKPITLLRPFSRGHECPEYWLHESTSGAALKEMSSEMSSARCQVRDVKIVSMKNNMD